MLGYQFLYCGSMLMLPKARRLSVDSVGEFLRQLLVSIVHYLYIIQRVCVYGTVERKAVV